MHFSRCSSLWLSKTQIRPALWLVNLLRVTYLPAQVKVQAAFFTDTVVMETQSKWRHAVLGWPLTSGFPPSENLTNQLPPPAEIIQSELLFVQDTLKQTPYNHVNFLCPWSRLPRQSIFPDWVWPQQASPNLKPWVHLLWSEIQNWSSELWGMLGGQSFSGAFRPCCWLWAQQLQPNCVFG